MQMVIPPHVETILQKLNQAGYEAYAVGGCVRDTLMGREPGDWDITTSARPEQVKGLFSRTVDTGIQHGTVTVLLGGVGFEVTTYRIDGEYVDGRHPKSVSFTPDLFEDLRRRDFTINAMAYSPSDGLVDAYGGIADLENRIIRCVGEARERFLEDALRMLRAVRFRAQLDFSIEENTKAAIGCLAPNLEKVSKERIQMELTKLLQSDFPERIGEVDKLGLIPFLSESFEKIPMDQIHILPGLPHEKYVRWAALLRLTGPEDAKKILKELKMDNDTIRKVETLVSWSGEPGPEEETKLRQFMSRMEPEVWDALCLLNQYEDSVIHLTGKIRERGDCLTLRDLAVNGQDLIAAGVKPGKAMGDCLKAMLELVLQYPEQNQKEFLLDWFVKSEIDCANNPWQCL